MKIIIAGSRGLRDELDIRKRLNSITSKFTMKIEEVVSGRAVGPDQIGEAWAKFNKIPIKEMPAEWNKHGKRAGPIRNREMAEYADACIVFWDGVSPGTRNMIAEMSRVKKPCIVQIIEIPKEEKDDF